MNPPLHVPFFNQLLLNPRTKGIKKGAARIARTESFHRLIEVNRFREAAEAVQAFHGYLIQSRELFRAHRAAVT